MRIIKNFSLLVLIALIGVLLVACNKVDEEVETKESEEKNSTEQDVSENLPDTVNIGYFEFIDDSLLVKQQGWLEEELNKLGVKLNWVSFQAGRDANNALLSKSIDFQISIGDPPVSIAVSSGIPYEIFWIGQVAGTAESLAAKSATSIADLKGKRIATTVASTSHYSLLSALELNGLSAGDVEIIDLTAPDILSAWQRGDLDAAYTWDPVLSELLKDGTRLISSEDLANQNYPTSYYGVVHAEFGEKYPQIVELYIEQLIRAQQLYAEKPEEAAKVWAEALQITPEDAEQQAKGAKWLTPEEQLSEKFLGATGKVGNTAQSLKKVGDFLVDQQSLPSKTDVEAYEKIINPAYLESAVK